MHNMTFGNKEKKMVKRYYDNTRIQEFRACPRKFFFRHVVHWSGEGFSPPLLFGSSWHTAMDAVWRIMSDKGNAQNLNTQEIAEAAFGEFMEEWLEGGGPDPKEMDPIDMARLEPRTPMIALEMLYAYVDQRRSLFQRDSFELLEVEHPFAVPLDPNDDDLMYVGRLDKIFRVKEGVIGGEHKTTSLYRKDGYFRSTFVDSFSPNSQVDGYMHALRILYGPEAKEVWIDGALVHKTVHEGFTFIPVERTKKHLEAWLWETRAWIANIEANWAAIEQVSPNDTYMAAFPKNTSACQDFARNGQYMELCKMWPNPTCKECPAGVKVGPWGPFERLEWNRSGLEE